MKNNYKDIFSFLERNKLGVTSQNIRIIENLDLADESTLVKIKEILDKGENNTNRYSEDIMIQLRQRLDLDKYDFSADEEINKMSKDDIMKHLFIWNGLNGWDDVVNNWVKEIYDVKLEDEAKTDYIIKCPYCNHEYEGLDFVGDTGDMEGDFTMPCEDGCGREFNVEFRTLITFESRRKDEDNDGEDKAEE